MTKNGKEPQGSPENEAMVRAAVMAASGSTGRDIASHLGVSEFTISRWRQTPRFRARVNQVQTEFQTTAISELRKLALTAVQTLNDIMRDPEAPATARVAAACQVLDRCGLGELPTIGPTSERQILEGDAQSALLSRMIDGLMPPGR
ncbi:MAG: hypothetical protein O2890_14870 [Cyanobacteria bacterium]|nr:hypothetical protein [Cyanobacteriota bacterium]